MYIESNHDYHSEELFDMDKKFFKCYVNKSLYSVYKELEVNEWKYYKDANMNNIISCFGDTNSTDYVSPGKMVLQYINAGGKSNVFNPIIDDIKRFGIDYELPISTMRSAHSLSVFLLGIVIYKMLRRKHRIIDWYGDEYNSGLYVWYLTCLFHDIGYYYEDNKKELGESIINECQTLNNYNFGCSYYNYRKKLDNEHKGFDHGVCGGFLLFNELNKIFDDHNKDERLCYDDRVKELYQIAAEGIVRHNMWLSSELKKDEDNEALAKYLESKVKYNPDNPYEFLLCLCDTLEPIKKILLF